MTNIVSLNTRESARAIRNRLWNPPASKTQAAKEEQAGRAEELRKQQDEATRAEADFRRQIALDNVLREAIADHARVRQIAAKILAEENSEARPPTIEMIVGFISREYGVSKTDIVSRRQSLRITLPRSIAIYLARRLTFKSSPEIGKDLGGRDHTTILRAVSRIEARMASDATFAALLKSYERVLGSAA